MTQLHAQQLCASLLAAWQSSGHPVGVDVHLRVQHLLLQLPSKVELPQLKTLLAPLLCRDKAEQQAFYALFDRILADQAAALPVRRPRLADRFRWQWLLLLLVLSALYLGMKKCRPEAIIVPTVERPPVIELQLGDTLPQPFCLGKDSLRYTLPALRHMGVVSVRNTSDLCVAVTPLIAGQDSLLITYIPRAAPTPEKQVFLRFSVQGYKNTVDTVPVSSNIDLQPKEYAHAIDIVTLRPKKGPQFSVFKNESGLKEVTWLHRMAWIFGLLSTLLIIGFLRNLVRFAPPTPGPDKQQKGGTDDSELDKSAQGKPPYTWQLKVPGADRFALDERAAYIIQMLRRRSEQDALVFDVPRTVNANIKQPGRVSFRYRNPTQIDEYLLLLDVRSRNDHRAQLFDLLYREFVKEEVLIERFFYDGDVRLCWNERNPGGLGLKELQHKFGECRLFVVGSGESLFSPVTGRLERWTETFEQWRHRNFLMTTPIAHWRSQEAELDELFRVAPASLQGLTWLVDSDAAPDDRDIDYWAAQPEAQMLPLVLSKDLSEEAIFAALDAEFTGYVDRKPDDRMLRWLAACAISPVLHWDATLFFGKYCDDLPKYPLLSLENLQELNRLDWFQTGKMPDNARRALLRWMEREHPKKLTDLRSAWQQLLEENLRLLQEVSVQRKQDPFEQSMAYEELRLQMIVNELALDDLKNKTLSLEKRQKLESDLDALRHRAPADFVALELLQAADEAAELRLQEGRDQAKDNPNELPILISGWRWQLPIFLVLATLVWLFDGSGERCKGSVVDYTPVGTLCVGTMDERAAVLERVLCDQIDFDSAYTLRGALHLTVQWDSTRDNAATGQRGHDAQWRDTTYQLQKIASPDLGYLDDLKRMNPDFDDRSARRNITKALWNMGLRAYQAGQSDSACLYFNNLERMGALRDSVLDNDELRFVLVALASCFADIGNVAPPVSQQTNNIAPKPPKRAPKDRSTSVSSRKNLPPPASPRRIPTPVETINDGTSRQTPVIPSRQGEGGVSELKPLELPSLEQAPTRFIFRIERIKIGQLSGKTTSLQLVALAKPSRSAGDYLWQQFDEDQSSRQFDSDTDRSVSDYMTSLLQQAVMLRVENVRSDQTLTFGDAGLVLYQEDKVPDALAVKIGIFVDDGSMSNDARIARLVNTKQWFALKSNLIGLRKKGDRAAFDREIAEYLLQNFSSRSRLGFFSLNLDQKADYPDGTAKGTNVPDQGKGQLYLDYSISNTASKGTKKN